MGTCLALFQVDHENVVVHGLPALNRALQTGDAAPLRELLKGMPFDESEELADYFQQRVARLREVGAPPMFIENEQRRLASVHAPSAEAIDQASLEELRDLLGSWCREARSTDLDQGWDLIHWYGDPQRRRRTDGDWRTQPAGFSPSAFDYALHGHEPYPCDASGAPVIRTGGYPEMSWYNPPAVVAEVAAAVAGVSTDSWDTTDRQIDATPEEDQPYRAGIEDRLAYARETFERFARCYRDAAGRGFGVSVEFY